MASILISGPAGAGKSQEAKRRRDAATAPTVVADFQSLVVAMLQQTRGPDGKYPGRPEWILPMAEATRRFVIQEARRRQIDVIATNSDGDPGRRRFLLDMIGPADDAGEIIVDPGETEVSQRLIDQRTKRVSVVCKRPFGAGMGDSRGVGGRWGT